MDEETKAWAGEAMYRKPESQREADVGLKSIRLPSNRCGFFPDHPHTHLHPTVAAVEGSKAEKTQEDAGGMRNAERSS